MHAIRQPLVSYSPDKPRVALTVDRHILAKLRWRGVAGDGTEFGFELERPLTHGAVILELPAGVYEVRQIPEAVLETLPALDPASRCAAAWLAGNLHHAIQVLPDRIRVPAEDSLRRIYREQGIAFAECAAVFQPQRNAHHHTH
ncbi:MAG: hypothetical protein O3B24_03060 [Verrucomicrobia bacterium]|nr:hypothetical protein [Verrucomicrobiota bacterium]